MCCRSKIVVVGGIYKENKRNGSKRVFATVFAIKALFAHKEGY
jgi:hypothetical protein